MVMDGIGTMICSLFGSPFGTVMYFGHPAYKKSGATTGYRCVVVTPEARSIVLPSVSKGLVFFARACFPVLRSRRLYALAAPGLELEMAILLARKCDRG